jgi:hypothetical protein
LLKLKSNILEGIDPNEFEAVQDNNEFEYDDDWEGASELDNEPISTNNVISIEEVLQRRTSVRLNRNRVVTLKT